MIGSNILNIALVIPIIGFFTTSNKNLDSVLLNRDMLVVSIVTLVFALFIFLQIRNLSEQDYKIWRFFVCLWFFVYILFLANIL